MDDSLPLLYSHCAHKCQQYTAILISQWRRYNKSNIISFYRLFPATFKTFKAEARPRFSHDTAGDKRLWRAILCSLHLRLLHMLSAGLNLALGDVTYTQSWIVHPPARPSLSDANWCRLQSQSKALLCLRRGNRWFEYRRADAKHKRAVNPAFCEECISIMTPLMLVDRAGDCCEEMMCANAASATEGCWCTDPSRFPPWTTNHWHSWIALNADVDMPQQQPCRQQSWNSY